MNCKNKRKYYGKSIESISLMDELCSGSRFYPVGHGIIFARLYRRASAEQAFVRTGLGGQKVVMSGGAIVMPIFHEIIPINMNTLKLEVSRSTVDSLITKDRMRVDVVVAFFVRVKPSIEGIATAAQTLGQRTLSPEDLRVLIEDKFVDALRATASQMTMHELQDTRENFVQGVQNTVAEDLSKTVWSWRAFR
jgi:uncharacterized membrane protein YqiK